MNLANIGPRCGTDKSYHAFSGMNYMKVYQRYFFEIAIGVRNLLELGVLDGKSLMAWRDYFPNAEIWGVDINPDTPKDLGPRIHVLIGSQTDPVVLDQVAPGLHIDIIIDDASHVVDHMVGSLQLLWPRVASRGFYAIEDLENIYADISESAGKWPGQSHNLPGTNYKNDADKLNNLFAAKLKELDQGEGDMLFLHRWHQQAILCKV